MITIVPYDPAWPLLFSDEAAGLSALVPAFRALEHIGSTAVPGLAAKPVIDMMAAVDRLDDLRPHLLPLAARGYGVTATDMANRLFLQRPGDPGFNLHIVTQDTWPMRKERLMRDALIADPAARVDYAALKQSLARASRNDIAAYTKAKTAFIQRLMNDVHDHLGLPRTDVWED